MAAAKVLFDLLHLLVLAEVSRSNRPGCFQSLYFAIFGGPKMLAGAFDQWMWRQIVALTLTDFILAWTLLVTGHLVMDYSEKRGSAPALDHKHLWYSIWGAFCAAAALPVIIVAYVYSGDDVKPWPFIVFGFLGVFVAALIHQLVHLLRRIIVPPGHADFGEAIPLLIPKSVLIKATHTPASHELAVKFSMRCGNFRII